MIRAEFFILEDYTLTRLKKQIYKKFEKMFYLNMK